MATVKYKRIYNLTWKVVQLHFSTLNTTTSKAFVWTWNMHGHAMLWGFYRMCYLLHVLAPVAEFPYLSDMPLTEMLQNTSLCPHNHAKNLITVNYFG